MPSACDSLLDDIEDMVTSHDPTPHERQFARKSIVPRARKQQLEPAEALQTDRCVDSDCFSCVSEYNSSVDR